jgi:hypothetical protein
MTDKRSFPAVIILLVILFFQVTTSMAQKYLTADEFHHHIASGYSYLVTGNFKMNPASPPLPRMLAALPLLIMGAKAPLDHPSWAEGDSPEFARQFFFRANDRLDAFAFWARMPTVILSALFGLSVFLFTRRLFGNVGALASAVLYVFCPDILAHSGLATADLPVAFFFFLTLVRFWRYLEKPKPKNAALAGVCAGLALLSKYSAVLLFPLLPLIAVAGGKTRALSLRNSALFLGITFLVVWAGYFFEMKPLLKDTPDPAKKAAVYEKIGGKGLLRFAEEQPVPLSTFISAIASMAYTRAQGCNAFLMGEWSMKGWWYYYYVAFSIKNTIPFLLMILLSLCSIRKLGLNRLSAVVLILPVLFFFIVTLRDKAQAGIRYFLPVYPLLFVLAGGWVSRVWRGCFFKTGVILLLGWHAAEALVVYPHAFSYFNQLAGGPPNGYRYLRDSNIDWGQDLKGLELYVKEKGIEEVALMTMASPRPGSPFRKIEEAEFIRPRNAVYAIGAHSIDSARWAKRIQPTIVIGHSIFVYDLRQEDLSLIGE